MLTAIQFRIVYLPVTSLKT